jgi:hypothetical protein
MVGDGDEAQPDLMKRHHSTPPDEVKKCISINLVYVCIVELASDARLKMSPTVSKTTQLASKGNLV